MGTFQDALRGMRTFHTVFLFTAFLYPATGEYLHPPSKTVEPTIFYAFLMAAGINVVIAVVLRQVRLEPIEEALRANMEDGAALARWRQVQILPLVLSESVCLFGLGLRFMGAPLARVVPFYGAAIILMVAFQPTDPRS